MVFLDGIAAPLWVVEWQPDNGFGAYWLIDAGGAWHVAGPFDLVDTPAAIGRDLVDGVVGFPTRACADRPPPAAHLCTCGHPIGDHGIEGPAWVPAPCVPADGREACPCAHFTEAPS